MILISPAFCEEVAYIHGESETRPLGSSNITDYKGTDQVTFTVASSAGSSATYKSERTVDDIKKEINQKINRGNQPVRDEGLRLVGKRSGPRRIDQICSIYDYLVEENNWTFVEDWKGLDQYQFSNYTLTMGKQEGALGKGDCDDFSILLAALVESVGGTPRIVFAYGPKGGHAYTEVYLGEESGLEGDVERMLKWLRLNYGVREIYTHNDSESGDVWLNLDWWKEPGGSTHPGGPFFDAAYHITVYPEDKEPRSPLTPLNEPPIAMFFSSIPNPNEGDNITFDASQSKDLGGSIERYLWDFGDGTKGEGKAVNHAYSRRGNFEVNLTVADNEGEASYYAQIIEVNELPNPVIDYEPKEPVVKDPIIIAFDASRSWDEDGRIAKWVWEFGDGDSGEGVSKKHIYSNNKGNYTVNLTAFDDKNARNTTSIRIKINEPPVSIIDIDPPSPNAGEEVRFDASRSIDTDGHIISYEWDLEEGITENGTAVSHIYTKSGSFAVKLRVKDDNNAIDENISTFVVNEPPVASFTYDPINPIVGEPITFNASLSKDPDGKIVKWAWDFGDEDKKGELVTRPYWRTGDYTIALTVTDNMNATNTTSARLTIGKPNQKPVIQGVRPDMPSPQESGALVSWTAEATDPENDLLLYKFFLDGKQVSDWSIENTWTWDTSNVNPSTYHVSVWVRDGKHAGLEDFDGQAESEFTISEQKTVSLTPSVVFTKPIETDIVEVRGAAATGDFTWTADNFAGFYYDIDDNIKTEELTTIVTYGNKLSGDQADGGLVDGVRGAVYTTTAQKDDFNFDAWGSYNVIGFLAEKYFAGYVRENNLPAIDQIPYQESSDVNVFVEKQLIRILVDDDSEMTVTSNTPLQLREGYELGIKAIDIDGNKVYLELSKNGEVIDSKVISPSVDQATMADKTYFYKADVGNLNNVVLVAVHFKNAFRGADQNLATVDGVWQLSDTPVDVSENTEYDKMTIQSVTTDTITMDNKDNDITLSKNKDISLMPGVNIKTADADELRYYIYKEVTEPGTYEIRGGVATGTYTWTWTADNFAGFYYDIDDNIKTEELTATITDGNKLSGDQADGGLVDGVRGVVYTTTAQQDDFDFEDWGSYNVMGFLAEKYFAGYIDGADTENDILFKESTDENVLADEQLLKILIDNDDEMTVTSSTPLRLEEGYELAIKFIDFDGNKVYLELTKNGEVIDSKVISPSADNADMVDKTYLYKADVKASSDVVLIAVHFKNAFRGADQNLATIDGIWQISDTATDVKADTEYDKMRIATVSSDTITMDNQDNTITLSKNRDISLMPGINIKTANSNELRYYIYKEAVIEGAEEEAAPS